MPEDEEADELALARRALVDDRRGYHATRSRSSGSAGAIATASGPTTAATAVL